MQNGFCHADGDLGRRGQGEPLRRVVPEVARLVVAARAAAILVCWSRQEHEIDDATREDRLLASHFQKQSHLPCVRGTWDAEIVDALKSQVARDDYVVTKHRASCFYGTSLEVYLRMRGIRVLVVAGVTTNYCVDSTVRDAYARDLDVIVVGDCCAGLWPDLHEASLKNTALYHGVVASRADVAAALGVGAE
jgi:ureidoacrylate peracid hydrolase